MKKHLLMLGMLLGFGQLSAQSYYIINKTGTDQEYNINGPTTGYKDVINTSASSTPYNEVLSAEQTLPFTWQFYGKDVTSYKISDNGYIVFNDTTNTSVGVNTTLPNASAPNNAIFAFWDQLEMKKYTSTQTWNSWARTWTYGTAPNRVHVIQWIYVTPAGIPMNQAYMHFAIRIFEKGNFDVIHNFGYGTAFSATTGVQNEDGTDATMVSGSPNLTKPAGTGSAADYKVYDFHYGTQPEIEASLVSSTVKNLVSKADDTKITGVIANYGSKAINSITLSYSVDGGTGVTQTFNNLTVSPNGGLYSYSFTQPWTGATPGEYHTIEVKIIDVNGTTDADSTNNSVSSSTFVNNGTAAEKRILLEEGSGAWCVWCPDGHVVLKTILEENDNVIGVVHHNNQGSASYDRMTNPESDKINSAYTNTYPYAIVNRSLIPGFQTVGLSRNDWAFAVTEANNIKSPVTVRITDKHYDAATRKITFTVKADFVDYATGDIRIGGMIVEDNVRGVGAGWDQKITTALTGNPDHPFYGYPTNMVGYIHNHVVENIPSGAWGVSGVIPGTVSPGQSYTKEFSWTLPAATTVTIPETSRFEPNDTTIQGRYKPEDISVLGFVAYYDANDLTKRQVLNAWETPLFGWGTSVKENNKDAVNSSTLYPNPVNGIGRVNFELTEKSQLNVEIYNALGQRVQQVVSGNYMPGNHTIMFDASALENGIYFLNIITNGKIATKRFAVLK